jgi:hypothetical protein
MKQTISHLRFLAVLTASALVVCSPASAQVKLQPKLNEGSDVSYEVSVLTNQVLTIAGMEFKTSVDSGETHTTTTGKWNAEGIIPIKIKTDSQRLNLTVPGGGQLLFDSSLNVAKTEQRELEPFIDMLRAMAGSTYTLLVDRKGEVTGVEGVQDILGRTPAKAAELLKAQLSVDKLKREFRESAESLPTDAVKPGDTWERTVTLDLGAGQVMKVERRYEYKGAADRNGRSLDEIEVVDKRIASFEIEANDAFPAKVANSELSPADDSKGRVYFDRELGIEVESQHQLHIKGKMTLTIQGMDLPTDLDLTIDSKSKVKK